MHLEELQPKKHPNITTVDLSIVLLFYLSGYMWAFACFSLLLALSLPWQKTTRSLTLYFVTQAYGTEAILTH